MNYYISDLHIGHDNVIKFDNRPFASSIEMNYAIINNWNSRVKTDDKLDEIEELDTDYIIMTEDEIDEFLRENKEENKHEEFVSQKLKRQF